MYIPKSLRQNSKNNTSVISARSDSLSSVAHSSLGFDMLKLSLGTQGIFSHLFCVGLVTLEFSRRNMFQEHFVNLLEGPSGGLWLVEVQVDPAQYGKTAKDK